MDLVTLVSEPTNLGPSLASVLGDATDANTSMLRHTDSLEVGTMARLSTIVSIAGLLTDPYDLILRVKNPAGTETFPSLSSTGVGTFAGDFRVDYAGQWRFKWVASSPSGPTAIREGSFIVRKSAYGDLGDVVIPSDAWGVGDWGSFPWPGDDTDTTWSSFGWGQSPWGG